VSCRECIVDYLPVGEAFQLRPYEGRPFARFDVKEFDDLVDIVVELDAQSVADVCG
jgi:hypothetical protein